MPDLISLDPVDLQRLSVLFLACADLSEGHYVLVRHSEAHNEWRVNVRLHGMEHTSTSHEGPTLALDRACQWLRAAACQR